MRRLRGDSTGDAWSMLANDLPEFLPHSPRFLKTLSLPQTPPIGPAPLPVPANPRGGILAALPPVEFQTDDGHQAEHTMGCPEFEWCTPAIPSFPAVECD